MKKDAREARTILSTQLVQRNDLMCKLKMSHTTWNFTELAHNQLAINVIYLLNILKIRQCFNIAKRTQHLKFIFDKLNGITFSV